VQNGITGITLCYAPAMAIFEGSTDDLRCGYPWCDQLGIERHHVTYQPEVVTNLCRRHHEDVTIINGQQARKYKCDLTTEWRLSIWNRWQQGRLKPRRTAKRWNTSTKCAKTLMQRRTLCEAVLKKPG
jgi:hypothetical protein